MAKLDKELLIASLIERTEDGTLTWRRSRYGVSGNEAFFYARASDVPYSQKEKSIAISVDVAQPIYNLPSRIKIHRGKDYKTKTAFEDPEERVLMSVIQVAQEETSSNPYEVMRRILRDATLLPSRQEDT